MDTAQWVSIGIAVIGVLLTLRSVYQTKEQGQIRTDVELLKHQTREQGQIRTDVELLKKQMSLFWGIVEKEIGNMLHSPHRAELDRLIEKNARRETLAEPEVTRFAELLQEMAEDPQATHGEQAAAVILKAAVLARHAHELN